MKRNPNIITLGPHYEEFPKEYWGIEDWRRHDARKEASRRLHSTAPLEQAPPPSPMVNPLGKDVQGDARRRERNINRLLEKHGLRPRRTW